MSGYRGSAWVYYCDDGRGRIKIGYSLNPWSRLAEFKTVNPEIEIVIIESTESRSLEAVRHRQFSKEHIAGEWFLKSDRLISWLDFLEAMSWMELGLKVIRYGTAWPSESSVQSTEWNGRPQIKASSSSPA